MSSQFPQSIETQEIKGYLVSLINPLNPNNTATGTSSVTINELSGIAVFTDPANGSAYTTFTVNNSLVTSESVIEWGVRYTPGTGLPVAGSYDVTNGAISFRVFNGNAVSTNANLRIQFRIIA